MSLAIGPSLPPVYADLSVRRLGAMPPSRPPSANSRGRSGTAGPSPGATAAVTKDVAPTKSVTSAASPKRRPRSAQPRRPPPPPSRSAPTGAATTARVVDPVRVLEALQRQCTDLKCAANTLTEDTVKTKTRLMALERELQKRERLLRQMVLLNQAGQGLGTDIIEKLREERNMLPIYRRRAQELMVQIEEKDLEIKNLKRNAQFTRIIELQVEYASWQHEAKRLDSLIQESNPNANPAAKREVEVQDERTQKLEAELQAVEGQRATLADELAEMEVDHAGWMQTYTEREQELTRQQDLTRDLAISFKQLLQDKKQAEQLENDIEEMVLTTKRYAEELAQSAASRQQEISASQFPGCHHVTQAVLRVQPSVLASSSSSGLWALRRAGADRTGSASLFAQLLEQDQDADGLLSKHELVSALRAWGGCQSSPEEVAAMLEARLGSISSPPAASPKSRNGIRWLDLLVMLDRVGSLPSGLDLSVQGLPDLRSLRATCIRAGITPEVLQMRFSGMASEDQAWAVFADIALEKRSVELWVNAWRSLGTQNLMLLLPLNEVSRCETSFKAWRVRCVDAVRCHKKELAEAFTVWRPDMMLTEAQFQMVCRDTMGTALSELDIDDLALYAGGGAGEGDTVHGTQVLQLV